jgi:hypothetical protein
MQTFDGSTEPAYLAQTSIWRSNNTISREKRGVIGGGGASEGERVSMSRGRERDKRLSR